VRGYPTTTTASVKKTTLLVLLSRPLLPGRLPKRSIPQFTNVNFPSTDRVIGHDRFYGGSTFGYFAVSVVPTVKLAFIPNRYGDWQLTAALTFFQTNNPAAARNNGKNQQLVFTSGIGLNF
jgi:hypothetical protein